ncbi:MAG: hypothetical protein KF831_10765 [Acidobacteria bacterium]|nr:hypothetical protein [Acidobacteriota bacterium]
MTEPVFLYSISGVTVAGPNCVADQGEIRHRPMLVIAANMAEAVVKARNEFYKHWPPADGWLRHEFAIDPWPLAFYAAIGQYAGRLIPSTEEPIVYQVPIDGQGDDDLLNATILTN